MRILAYTGELYSLSMIKQKLQEKYSLDIPDHVLSEICRRAVKKEYIEYNNGKYYITPIGNSYVGNLIEEREIERKANSLAEHFSAFLKDEGFGDVTIEESLRILLDFINRNLVPLAGFVTSPLSPPEPDKGNIYSRAIVKYLEKIEKSNPDSYQFLVDLLYGSIVCTLVQARDEKVPRTLKSVNVFLDTNTIFSILGFHYDEINRPSQELMYFLKEEKCNLYVFDFTIDEMVSVLNYYVKEYQNLWECVRVDSIYSSLKVKGKTPADVRLMIANLEDTLYKIGIKVFSTKYKLTEEPIENDKFAKLATYKPYNNNRSLNHDILAINEIIKLRGGRVYRRLQNCKAIFVSSDNKLTKYNFIEYQHNHRSSITEVINDRILTQILWVKNPTESRLPLFSAIAAHSRALFVDRVVWKKFFDVISMMHNKNDLTSEELSLLFYSQNIEYMLIIGDNPDAINEEYIRQRVELIRIGMNKEKEEHLAKMRENEFSLLSATKDIEKEKEEKMKLVEEIEFIKARMNKIAKQRARTITNGFCCLAILLIILLAGLLYFSQKEYLSAIVGLITIMGYFGIKPKITSYIRRMENKIENSIYRRLTKMYLA